MVGTEKPPSALQVQGGSSGCMGFTKPNVAVIYKIVKSKSIYEKTI